MEALAETPPGLVEQRIALHRLATYVIAPARHRATGRFGLRWTPGGFATPPFGANEETPEGERTSIRVVEDRIERVSDDNVLAAAPISTLQAAADFLHGDIDTETAAEHDSPPVGDVDAKLSITREVVTFLGSWWGLGSSALEVVRSDETSVEPSEVQLWPGHFDVAIEVGDEDRRASVGASPGDDGSSDPYLYVSVWWPDRLNIDTNSTFWNADGYVGATLPYSIVQAAEDPLAAAVSFFRQGRDELLSS